MAGLVANVDISGALQRLGITKDEYPKAMARALNKTATTARVQASRAIQDAGYNLKAGDLKKAISIRKANTTQLIAALRAIGRPIPLIKYGARQTSKGVTVQVKAGRKLITEAFIATMPTGHKGVFVRVDSAAHGAAVAGGFAKKYRGKMKANHKHGLPIRELFGPAIPAAFANDVVQQALRDAIDERFPVVMRQELAYIKSLH